MSEYTLYTYFRSSSSARLRIALNHKQIPHTLHPVNLLKNEHLSDAHRALNPSATVPLLVREQPDAPSSTPLRITQSLAALEYLDEAHPSAPHLLPRDDADSRAAARALAGIIASDTQPVTNLRIVRRVRPPGRRCEAWMREPLADGFAAL
ncbi:maleylacetoacetate isomerase [Verticillium alfalfae VaMs.102]|uniref:Maleylacetoacetate isomerase n=1 Tax=Verticillium alfalfae (strain VaMs.102 / ATCC MYA-4576 / FGSC 10136) TaxID=526221 RepID=C9SD73_VERA1|nr:maleylacetoacetate isomerase [Verticillium alfalfae VaMs.102]EEY17038.1 maleylacetoacetate isomerase [Verticillium alfalfae VaMs.102]